MLETDSKSFIEPMIRATAIAIGGSRAEAISLFSKHLEATPEQVSSWASGVEPVPTAIANRLTSRKGDSTTPESALCRDEWVVADGQKLHKGSRREYVMHMWPPRFICRAISVEPGSGLPEDAEQPADAIGGLTYVPDDCTVMGEFHWLDPVPANPALQELLHGAADALYESGDE